MTAFAGPRPPDMPASSCCPVTGKSVDTRLGWVPIRFHDDDGALRQIAVGATDLGALREILTDPETYGMLAWNDYLEQCFAEERTPMPLPAVPLS